MERVVALTLLAIAVAPLYAAPRHPVVKKPSTTASAAHKPAISSRASAHTGSASVHLAPAATKSGHAASASAMRGRSVKGSRVAHAAPAPSYQLHPDPERYQTIQQALTDRGYFKGEVNGTWSDDSTDAMRRFQADQKIDNDGKIDALSLIGLGLGPKHDGTTAAESRLTPTPANAGASPPLIQPSNSPANSAQPR